MENIFARKTSVSVGVTAYLIGSISLPDVILATKKIQNMYLRVNTIFMHERSYIVWHTCLQKSLNTKYPGKTPLDFLQNLLYLSCPEKYFCPRKLISSVDVEGLLY